MDGAEYIVTQSSILFCKELGRKVSKIIGLYLFASTSQICTIYLSIYHKKILLKNNYKYNMEKIYKKCGRCKDVLQGTKLYVLQLFDWAKANWCDNVLNVKNKTAYSGTIDPTKVSWDNLKY